MKTEKRYAKVGERILIVAAKDNGGFYENGDELKVQEVFESGQVRVFEANAYFKSIDVYADEYEVIIDDVDSIKEELEAARSNMNQLADEFGLMHQKVIEASQRLDGLLNRYDALSKKE